ETPGQTLQPTALAHEAYLRLVDAQQLDGRGHFFAAAAEAMRRIRVENARWETAGKHGGDRERVESDTVGRRSRTPAEESVPLRYLCSATCEIRPQRNKPRSRDKSHFPGGHGESPGGRTDCFSGRSFRRRCFPPPGRRGLAAGSRSDRPSP